MVTEPLEFDQSCVRRFGKSRIPCRSPVNVLKILSVDTHRTLW